MFPSLDTEIRVSSREALPSEGSLIILFVASSRGLVWPTGFIAAYVLNGRWLVGIPSGWDKGSPSTITNWEYEIIILYTYY